MPKNPDPNERIVYSSEHGRMCPECQRPVADCACAPGGQAPPPGDGIVRVGREKRRGKDVTVIRGIQSDLPTLKATAKSLKKQCGTGGTVKDFTIEIQGDYRDIVIAALEKAGHTVKRSGG